MKKLLLIFMCLVLSFGIVACTPERPDPDEKEAIEKKGNELIKKYVDEIITPVVSKSCTLEEGHMFFKADVIDGKSAAGAPSRIVEAEVKAYGNTYHVYADTATEKIYTDFFLKRDRSKITDVKNEVKKSIKDNLMSYFTKYISEDDFVIADLKYNVGSNGCTYFYIESLDIYDPVYKKKINTVSQLLDVLPGDINCPEKYEEYFAYDMDSMEIMYISENSKVFPDEVFANLKKDNFKYNFTLKRVANASFLEMAEKDSSFYTDGIEYYSYSTDGKYQFEIIE